LNSLSGWKGLKKFIPRDSFNSSLYILFSMVKTLVYSNVHSGFTGIRTIFERYRVSHETWQLLNSFECLLPYAIQDVKDFLQFTSLKNLLLKYILLWNQFYYIMTAVKYFLFFSLVSKNLTNYGRLKLLIGHCQLCTKGYLKLSFQSL